MKKYYLIIGFMVCWIFQSYSCGDVPRYFDFEFDEHNLTIYDMTTDNFTGSFSIVHDINDSVDKYLYAFALFMDSRLKNKVKTVYPFHRKRYLTLFFNVHYKLLPGRTLNMRDVIDNIYFLKEGDRLIKPLKKIKIYSLEYKKDNLYSFKYILLLDKKLYNDLDSLPLYFYYIEKDKLDLPVEKQEHFITINMRLQ